MPKTYHLSSGTKQNRLTPGIWDRSHRETERNGQKLLGQWSFIGIVGQMWDATHAELACPRRA
jgi:hypothetical protein